jgi:hypothetical protein
VLTRASPDAAAGDIASADATSAIAAALRTTPRTSLRPDKCLWALNFPARENDSISVARTKAE